VCLSHTPPTAGLWPLLSDRAVSLCLTVPLVALYPRGRIPANGARLVLAAAACGVILVAGDIAVLYATRVDLLTAGPLIALYPAVTVTCARILRHEGIPRRRRLGLVFAGVAVLALTIGG
jgi:drug/metabolite transporter (DMT)-like permease